MVRAETNGIGEKGSGREEKEQSDEEGCVGHVCMYTIERESLVDEWDIISLRVFSAIFIGFDGLREILNPIPILKWIPFLILIGLHVLSLDL